jgi:hypothetical protein
MLDFILGVLSTATISTILVAALAWLLRSWIAERLKNAIKHEYDREIAAYKSVLSLVQSATAEGQKAAIEARLKAFDRVWKATLALRNHSGAITTFLDAMTVADYGRTKADSQFQKLIGGIGCARLKEMNSDLQVEEARPYVGEIVWALFFAYQAIHIRLALLIGTGTDAEIVNWHTDAANNAFIRAVLDPIELQAFEAIQFGKIAFFRRTVESKILMHWEKLISGAQHGDEAAQQAQAILRAADQINDRK